MRFGVAAPARASRRSLVVISTLSGRSCRKAPRAMASCGSRLAIIAANVLRVSKHALCAQPDDITQAEPSLFREPSAFRLIRFVSGPPALARRVISTGIEVSLIRTESLRYFGGIGGKPPCRLDWTPCL